jgi:hypothetical protein
MTEDVRYFLEGGPFFVQRRSESVAKGMGAEEVFMEAGPSTGSVHGVLNDSRPDAHSSGRNMQKEYVPVCRFGSSVAQIIDNGAAEPFW